jgi:hypothetical protein
MPDIHAEWSVADLAYWRSQVNARTLARALKRAGKDALKSMRADAKRRVRDRVRIRAGYLADKAFPLVNAMGTDIDALEWRMKVSGAAVPLGEYPRRQLKAGVRVEVQKGKVKLIKSAFLAMTKRGRKGVFLREEGVGRYPMGHRLGLRTSDSMADGQIPAASLDYAAEQFAKRFGYWLPRELNK